MQLTPHFSLEELVFSSTAVRKGIDNTAPSELLPALHVLAAGLEQVRVLLGSGPIHIDSGYRCPALNQAVGGVYNSAHLSGFAADIVSPPFGTPLDIVRKISTSGIKFDQLIVEGVSEDGTGGWAHISFAPTMRQQVMTAIFVNGKAHYVLGINPS